MKQLMILRHADALHHAHSGSDHDRPLSPRGHTQCKHLHQWLLQQTDQIPSPQTTLCSPATRTRETLAEMPPNMRPETDTHYPRTFYYGGTSELIRTLKDLPPEIDSVLIVGHNPSVSQLASDLVNAPIGLSTCTLICLESPADDWTAIDAHRATLRIRIRGEK